MTDVLTIEREYGSGAASIAQKVAARLGWKLWDQLLTDHIARRMECDRRHVEQHEERRDPLHYRLFKAFLRGSFEGSLNEPRMRIADAEGIRQVTEQDGPEPTLPFRSRAATKTIEAGTNLSVGMYC